MAGSLFATAYFSCYLRNTLLKVITYHNSFVEHKAEHMWNEKRGKNNNACGAEKATKTTCVAKVPS